MNGILEGYVANRRVERVVPLQTGAQCQDALSHLGDGTHSALYVEDAAAVSLTIAGGPERFQVSLWDTATDAGKEAVDGQAPVDAEVSMICAGQHVVLARRETLSSESALVILTRFARRVAVEDAVSWEDAV